MTLIRKTKSYLLDQSVIDKIEAENAKVWRYHVLREGVMALFSVCYRDTGSMLRDFSSNLDALRAFHRELGLLIEDIEQGKWQEL